MLQEPDSEQKESRAHTLVDDLVQEHGPLLINATGGLMRNPYSWTKQANMLILESCFP